MADSIDELRQRINEVQAVRGIDADTRNVIGLLSETINTLDEEIDDLQQRVDELEDVVEEYEQEDEEGKKQAWYSER